MWRKLLLITLLHLANQCQALRLTNMTAPAVQDPRQEMKLHCRFDMGGEDLYAVKWYKDDHEFFRYTPGASQQASILQFPVAGVHVDDSGTRCSRTGCDLRLTDLSRPQSSGAYRCEVSSEAPAFRLASQTHNVTVAALPDEKPKIDGLADSYLLGDILTATCTSGLGDPKPILTWYVNKQQVPSKRTQEVTSGAYIEDRGERIKLKSSTITLKFPLDKKLSQNRARTNVDISCISSIDGINPVVAPPLTSTKIVALLDQNLLVNNQKLHMPSAAAAAHSHLASGLLLTLAVVRWFLWC